MSKCLPYVYRNSRLDRVKGLESSSDETNLEGENEHGAIAVICLEVREALSFWSGSDSGHALRPWNAPLLLRARKDAAAVGTTTRKSGSTLKVGWTRGRTDADKNESGSDDEGAETEREARGGNLGNCETMEDADVLALGGAGGRRTAVLTKHEALPPALGILRLGAERLEKDTFFPSADERQFGIAGGEMWLESHSFS